jgi:cysteine desulfurase
MPSLSTSGGTESDNLAIKGVAHKHKKGHIITSKIEHPAVLSSCASLAKEGYDISYLDVDKDGIVNIEALRKAITNDTILVSIMHANNEIGTIQPIKEIGEICKEKKIVFHTDAVQSYTKLPIDVNDVDLISLSAHKLHGPKGIGALYIKKGTKIMKFLDGGGHEFHLRAGTENIPGIIGFTKAVELMNDKDIKHMKKLRDKLIKELLKIPDTHLNGSQDQRLCNNANISFHFVEGESFLMYMDDKGIAVSTGSACSSHSLKPSHVLMALGLKPEVAHGSIRFTLSRYTTDQEIEYTIKSVKEVVERLRKFSPLAR